MTDFRAPGLLARPLVLEGRRWCYHRPARADGVAARVVDVTGRVVKLQSGYIYHYAFAMLVGLAAVITWYVASGSANVWLRILSCIVFLPLVGAVLFLPCAH